MADYQRRVRLTLTRAEAKAVADAVTISRVGRGAPFFEAAQANALERAEAKLLDAITSADVRNAEKRQAKADAR